LIPHCREKPLSVDARATVPQTDTGRWVEDTKAIERTLVKELGKLTPYLRKKGYLLVCGGMPVRRTGGWHKPGPSDCLPKTQVSAERASGRIGADACPVPEG
jgi:hypothetical protein